MVEYNIFVLDDCQLYMLIYFVIIKIKNQIKNLTVTYNLTVT